MIRPRMLYSCETWAITKSQEKALKNAEMKMLRWSQEKTRLDKVKNETIRKNMGVRCIGDKMKEKRLRWYGHIQRRGESHCCRKVSEIKLEGKRKKGRPQMRWKDKLKAGMKEMNLKDEDCQDREKWRKCTAMPDPSHKMD